MRVDIWDIPKQDNDLPLDCGYPRNFDEHFTIDRTIGKGGFGLVRVVIEKCTGQEFACKSIRKRLDVPNISFEKLAQHLDNIDREAKILKRLRGTLSVAHFKGAWEDDADVHLVMEYCRGGELHHSIGLRMYTEAHVAAFMRSVFHTLAQCHSHRILHRDIKPGNFMLLNESENSPLKAIDFGLACFYDPESLPRTDLGLDGTPWFMAPEVLNSQTYPASDIWAAGVMAYQLLSGYLPFDDARNPDAPALSVVWRGILTEEPSFRRSAWQHVSNEAKDFVISLLNKDHEKRPSAKEALKHSWLSTTFHDDKSRPLSNTVVQRIQRFAQTNILRRTILELMASELLKMAPPKLSDASLRGGASAKEHLGPGAGSPVRDSITNDRVEEEMITSGDGSTDNAGFFPIDSYQLSPEQRNSSHLLHAGAEEGGEGERGSDGSGGSTYHLLRTDVRRTSLDFSGHGGTSYGHMARSPSVQQLAALARAARRGGAATVHGPGDYWRIMRKASELAAMESGHGQMNYLRVVPRNEEERQEQRKAARLSLDTSRHGDGRYREFMDRLELESNLHSHHHKLSGIRNSRSMGALGESYTSSAPSNSTSLATAVSPSSLPPTPLPSLFPAATRDELAIPKLNVINNDSPVSIDDDTMEKGGRGRSLAIMALQEAGEATLPTTPATKNGEQQRYIDENSKNSTIRSVIKSVKKKIVTFGSPTSPHAHRMEGGTSSLTAPSKYSFLPASDDPFDEKTRDNVQRTTTKKQSIDDTMVVDDAKQSIVLDTEVHNRPVTNPKDLENLMKRLRFCNGTALRRDAFAEGLKELGYDLDPEEMNILLDQLDLDKGQHVEPARFVASQIDWSALQSANRDLWLECARRSFGDLDKNSDGKVTVEDILASLKSKLPPEEVDFALEDAMVEGGGLDAEDIDFEGFLKMLRVGSLESLDSLDQYDDRMRRVGLDAVSGDVHKLETVHEDLLDGARR